MRVRYTPDSPPLSFAYVALGCAECGTCTGPTAVALGVFHQHYLGGHIRHSDRCRGVPCVPHGLQFSLMILLYDTAGRVVTPLRDLEGIR